MSPGRRNIRICGFDFIGRGNPKVIEELSRKAIAAGHPDLIEFPDSSPESDLPEYLSAHPRLRRAVGLRGGPGVCLPGGDGMWFAGYRLPRQRCIGSSRNGETGFLVPPRNVDSLHKALARLLSDENMRTEMGRCARDLCRTRGKQRGVSRADWNPFTAMLSKAVDDHRSPFEDAATPHCQSAKCGSFPSFDDPAVAPHLWKPSAYTWAHELGESHLGMAAQLVEDVWARATAC